MIELSIPIVCNLLSMLTSVLAAFLLQLLNYKLLHNFARIRLHEIIQIVLSKQPYIVQHTRSNNNVDNVLHIPHINEFEPPPSGQSYNFSAL